MLKISAAWAVLQAVVCGYQRGGNACTLLAQDSENLLEGDLVITLARQTKHSTAQQRQHQREMMHQQNDRTSSSRAEAAAAAAGAAAVPLPEFESAAERVQGRNKAGKISSSATAQREQSSIIVIDRVRRADIILAF